MHNFFKIFRQSIDDVNLVDEDLEEIIHCYWFSGY